MVKSIENNNKQNNFNPISRIACHVPDLLLDWIPKLEVPSSKRFNGVVLFADIQGILVIKE